MPLHFRFWIGCLLVGLAVLAAGFGGALRSENRDRPDATDRASSSSSPLLPAGFTKLRGRLSVVSEQFICAYGIGVVSRGWQAALVVETPESLKGREIIIRPCFRSEDDLMMSSAIGDVFQFDVPTESIFTDEKTIWLDPLDDVHLLVRIKPSRVDERESKKFPQGALLAEGSHQVNLGSGPPQPVTAWGSLWLARRRPASGSLFQWRVVQR